MKYSDCLNSISLYDFKDKDNAVDTYISYMLARTNTMFDYDGLPDTIPKRALELYLQCNGDVCIAEYNNNLYAFSGGYGGKRDEYYVPTEFTVSNPYLELSKTYRRDFDCVIINNDTMYMGLLPLFTRYATMLTEIDISTLMATINSRISVLISATDDSTRASAMEFIDHLLKGDLSVVSSSEFLEGIKTQPYATAGDSDRLTKLIELNQYVKAGWYNELGLQSNYNMKRESINSNESQLNDDMLKPLIDDMEQCRIIGVEKVNKMFGTNITVKRGGAWAIRNAEIESMTDDNEPTPNDTGEGGENND